MTNEKEGLVEELKVLLQQNVTEIKEQVESLKTKFYRQYHEEQAALRKAAEEAAKAAGEELAEWEPQLDAVEQEFRTLLNTYREKKAAVTKEIEQEQAQNLMRKENILAQMKEMAGAETADVMDNIKKMKELQAEWKTIGAVPAPKANEIWKQYQQYQEQFYDLVKINIELRDLDFKKNFEMKTLLCEAAEKLKDNPNIVEASRALQQLHEEWAEIGPVARELREELWSRFKEASSVINKKHQAYFDALHAKESENLEKKKAIIEKLKAIDFANFKTNRQWERSNEQVQALREEWRTIGFAPKKQNQTIYDEYKALCEDYFKAKTAYYRAAREVFSENLKLKKALIAKAQELTESTAWKETADALAALQKEWKTIGPVAHKYSDAVWKQFTDTCDAFFEKKRAALKEAKADERKSRMERAVADGDRAKLIRMYENLQQEIKTAENNILFFTGKTKSANKLVDSMQAKIDTLKKQLADLEEQINSIE